jgi:preprotein translocase subunit SecD
VRARRVVAAGALLATVLGGTPAAAGPAPTAPSIVRFRPVLAELPPPDGPVSVTQAQADAITLTILSCDPSAVLGLPVVSTMTAANDVADSCVVLPVTESVGSARLYLGPAQLTDTDIQSVRRRFVPNHGYVVEVRLTTGGKRGFDKLTADLYRRRPPRDQVAITVDGAVVSVPTIERKRFPDGALQIAGNLTKREAGDLAAAMGRGREA